jgi:phosphatidylserine decarboxylase
MINSGKASQAAQRILLLGAAVGIALALALRLAGVAWPISAPIVASLFVLFTAFTLYFFRDPDAEPSSDPSIIVAPAHGKVDAVDEVDEPTVMGGRCRRISIFLSVFDVHVQQAPLDGRVIHVEHRSGQFLNAMKLESATLNENVLIGLEPDLPGLQRVGVRLITGLIARRIIPWIQPDQRVSKGDRVSLIQFGSRVDLYLPLETEVLIQCGARVIGGTTAVARHRLSP